MLEAYKEGRIDRLFLASNEFENTMTQTPYIRQLLPLTKKKTKLIRIIGTIFMSPMQNSSWTAWSFAI